MTQIECNSLEKAVTTRPDEVFKRENPSMWIDTYYVDPNSIIVNVSQSLTSNTQVSNLDSEQETSEIGSQIPDCKDPQAPINDVTPDISNEEVVQVNEAEVSSHQTPTNDEDDMSDPLLQGKSVQLPYVIYNLDNNKSIYIQKGTIVAYANKDEPEVDCFKISETYEEAQEAIQYRNHLPNCPTLPVPPKSDMICSPARVKVHRRVELKDHNTSAGTKKRFEELCQ